MKRSTVMQLCLLLILAVCLGSIIAHGQPAYLSVNGPCNLSFPRDHGPHPGYRTEWWYYTGNLRSESGNRYGFQLTLFRSQISPPGAKERWPRAASAWRTQQIYLGHAAVSAPASKQHLQAEIAAREALDLAGGTLHPDYIRIFVKDWFVKIEADHQFLAANTDDFSFELNLKPAKPPVLHGNAGYSRKGSSPERASCYYSFTRLYAKGVLSLGGKKELVAGSSWMDHEFSTAPLEPELVGWDWVSLQLSDKTELMFFFLRDKKGEFIPESSGTFIGASGKTMHLARSDLNLEVLDSWKSPRSKAVYPARWRLQIYPLSMDLIVTPVMADQEMQALQSTGITYWEGSVTVEGKKQGRPVRGQGYVELTGYARAFDAPI